VQRFVGGRDLLCQAPAKPRPSPDKTPAPVQCSLTAPSAQGRLPPSPGAGGSHSERDLASLSQTDRKSNQMTHVAGAAALAGGLLPLLAATLPLLAAPPL
jgi:hypothetical protein